MKQRSQVLPLFILISCFVLLASSTEFVQNVQYFLDDVHVAVEFGKFMSKYNKSYPTPEEEAYRFRVFKRNFRLIFSHNHEVRLVNPSDGPSPSYTLEINRFADMTDDEHASRFLGAAMERPLRKNLDLTKRSMHPERSTEMPKEFDWRVKGAVSTVKDQKSCGSCWAFSAAGAIEGAWFLNSGKLVNLSQQQLVDCSSSFGNHGCDGGLMDQAFEYVISSNGVQTEESYPYMAIESNRCKFNKAEIVAKISSFADVPSGDEDALMTAVLQQPVSVAIDAGKSSFRFYKSGVYFDKSCSSTRLNHGVLAVGYGHDDDMGDYWIVKNSWGTGWGDGGYIKMARNKKNHCGIATDASYPIV